MANKLFKSHKNRAALAFASLGTVASTGMTVLSTVSADTVKGQEMTLAKGVSAGSFDLTKKATGELKFPVEFDRPSGVNAAALAGTVVQLGSNSDLYKSAVAAVPALADSSTRGSLLNDALDASSPNHDSARQTIVALIDWYNTLGGQAITTQSGEPYTTENLDEPINVLAVAFSNANSISEKATTTLAAINQSKTVGDVQAALESFQSGVSKGYSNAFNAYAQKVYAPDADIAKLSEYSSLKPVLDAYQDMYVNGASSIRATLLNGAAGSTEAGVTFFESAVIAGGTNDQGGDSNTNNNVPDEKNFTTKWVDEDGNPLDPPVTNSTGFEDQREYNEYDFKTSTTDGNTKTYVYTKKTPEKPAEKTEDTVWVDEEGNVLKDKTPGTLPDNDGKSDIEGYVVISTKTTTDEDGNTHTVNTYHKVASDTVWVDEDGNVLKDKTDGEFPDNDGESDIDGYKLVGTKTVTDKNGDRHIINTYTKNAVEDLPDTYWFDDEGNTLKDKVENQTLPDDDGKSDIEGYTLLKTYTVTEADVAEGGSFAGSGFGVGDTINIYQKDKEPETPTPEKPDTPEDKIVTNWVDGDGNPLKDPEDGAKPDNDGNDIPGYKLDHIETDDKGNVTNIYHKIVTHWVDEDGNTLQDDKDGEFPDKEGDDIEGYELVDTLVDEKTGDITNVYKKTPAPEPEKPEAPVTPEAPAEPEQAPSQAKQIPQTGTDDLANATVSAAGIGILSALGLAGIIKRRRRED